MRRWLAGERSLERLNCLAAEQGLRTESGRPVRFVAPGAQDAYYEVRVYETGQVATRAESAHDYFNALAWLAFPRAKARLNALHAAAIPREGGKRGRLRDLLTIFDEGGAILHCDDAGLLRLLRERRWKELFWDNRERVRAAMQIVVFGHAVLEKALEPWPGVACKAIVAPPGSDSDTQVFSWLAGLPVDATPRLLPAVPVFGYPGWMPQSTTPAFYDDARYFRAG